MQSHLLIYQVGFILSSLLLILNWVYIIDLSRSGYVIQHKHETETIYKQRRFCLLFWFLLLILLCGIFFTESFANSGFKSILAFYFGLTLLLVAIFFFPGKSRTKITLPIVLNFFYTTAYPFWLVNEILQRTGDKESKLIDLELVLENGENEPTVEDQQMLRGIVKFSETEIRQIMTPKSDIVLVNNTDLLSEIIETVRENGYSRMPVVDTKSGVFVGTLHAKDLLTMIDQENASWDHLVRPPYFVSEEEKIIDLLEQFQQRKIHQALVVDELKKHVGLVTLEDVIEEIVGDITDEFDDEDLTYSKVDALNYIFETKTTLKDLVRVLSLETLFFGELPENETIADFLNAIKTEYPKRGQKINYRNLSFTIESTDKRKIRRVKITITE